MKGAHAMQHLSYCQDAQLLCTMVSVKTAACSSSSSHDIMESTVTGGGRCPLTSDLHLLHPLLAVSKQKARPFVRRRCTSCKLMMALWGLSISHSSLARSRPAPGTCLARASREAVVAASKCPLTLHSLACCSQHCPASASAPLSTASWRLRAKMGSCTKCEM